MSDDNVIFKNGFMSFCETLIEVSSFIEMTLNSYENPDTSLIHQIQEIQGRGGLYELAVKWADEFEHKNLGRAWDGEFYDEIETFLIEKNSYQPAAASS